MAECHVETTRGSFAGGNHTPYTRSPSYPANPAAVLVFVHVADQAVHERHTADDAAVTWLI